MSSASTRRANPLLAEQSEYVQAIHREGASTLASVPGSYFGQSGERSGNSVSDAPLATIATRGQVGANTRTSQAGAPRSRYGTNRQR